MQKFKTFAGTNPFQSLPSFSGASRPRPRTAADVFVDAQSAQIDWINRAAAFDTLEVRLQNSSNAGLNGLIDTDHIYKDISLDWREQFVGRFGVEFQAHEHWTFRAGYSFGRNPADAATLSPLTTAIAWHTVSAGTGYRL